MSNNNRNRNNNRNNPTNQDQTKDTPQSNKDQLQNTSQLNNPPQNTPQSNNHPSKEDGKELEQVVEATEVEEVVVEAEKEQPKDAPKQPEVKETRVVSANPPKVDSKPEQVKEVPSASSVVALVETKGSPGQRALVAELEKYKQTMRRGIPQGFNDKGTHGGAQRQYSLWVVLRNIIQNYDQEEFRRTWTTLLAYVHENRKGLFEESLVMRFSEYWTQDEESLSKFQRIINLILITSDQQNRSNLNKLISLDKTLRGFDEESKRRILEYYS